MAQNAEANILITIKEKGKEALDGIKDSMASIVKVGAAMVAALVSIGAAIGKLATDASQFEEIKSGFDRLAASQGANADTIVKKMKEASDGVLSTAEIMKAANEAMLAGIPIDQLAKITEIAKAAANAQGESLENMMSVMTNGLARTSTMMLRHAGIVFDETEAYKSYAKSIGKTTEELTDNEKRQVFLNKALQVGQQTLDKLGPSQISVSDQWERFKSTQEDNAIILGQKLIPAFRVFLNILEDMDDGFKRLSNGTTIIESLTEAAIRTLRIFQMIGAHLTTVIELVLGLGFAIKGALTGNLNEVQAAFEETFRNISERYQFIERSTQERLATIRKEFAERQEQTEEQRAKENSKKEIELAKTREANKAKAINDIRKQWEDKYVQSDYDTFVEGLEIKKKLEADALDERVRRREQAEEEEKQYMQNFVSGIQTFTSEGLKGLTSKTLGFISETFIPYSGAAVSAIFDVLSQGTDQFNETLNNLFSEEFIDNVLRNLLTLVEALPGILDRIINYLSENMPAIVERLIAAIIANLPKISGSLLKALIETMANPKFQGDLASAIAKGFIQGAKEAAGEITEAIKKGVRDGLDVAGGAASAGKGILGKVGGIFTGGFGSFGGGGGGFGFAHGGMIKGYAGGGLIDNQLIRATAGEFMVNRDSASANLGLLEAINNSNGRSVQSGNNITIVVNGGMLGDRQSAQQFARAVDEELYRLRQGNASRAFDRSLS